MKFVAKVDAGALPKGIMSAYFRFIQSFWEHGTLDPQLKELIRMRSATLSDCKQ